MTRTIDLDATLARDRTDYKLLCDALLSRGSQARDARTGELPRLTKEQMRTDAKIKRALWAIGEPDDEASIPVPNGDEPDRRPRKLVGGTLALEQPEFLRLTTYVEQTQWTVAIVEQAVELMDRLSAAKEQPSEGTIPATSDRAKLKRV